MNREIKFRGKNYENKWKYGDLVQEKWKQGKAIMIKKETTAWSVLEDTVGQYTGLDDKNGKEIYEGDIVLLDCYYYEEPAFDGEFKVIYDDINGMWLLVDLENKDRGVTFGEIRSYYKAEIEVIGNIYDNPELLGGEDEC